VPAGFPNQLPPGSLYDTPVSIVFPGQAGVVATGGSPGTLTSEVLGGTVSYAFEATEPGTYLYESGTAPESQVQMGLYGGLLVYPTDGSVSAYGAGTGTDYEADREYLLVLHEIDPNYHMAIERNRAATPPNYVPGSFLGQPDPPGTLYHYRYWTVNGRAMPDTLAANFAPWLPNQPFGSLIQVEPGETALVRYANAGLENHPFHPHGNHLRVVAQDGRVLADSGAALSVEAFTKTVASGQSFDLLAHWDPVEGYDADTNPVPVTIPGLQNLVFADDATYYSGSPYLGDQDSLPVGVTGFGECGEYYFPWHSHALYEFQNFDEGFGGMATLWRVDPPGGCQ
jgi:FtsP/CotA-like multicopper oxidase with cupredoxin domain